MELNREIVFNKLQSYFNRQITRDAIYEWALFVAVSKDFEAIVKTDTLVSKTIYTLLDIDGSEPAKVLEAHHILEYCRRCLAGELEYEPLGNKKILEKLGVLLSPEDKKARSEEVKEKVQTRRFVRETILICKIYVLIFAVCSLAVHLLAIISPGLLRPGVPSPTRWDAFWDSFPLITYALLLSLPFKVGARGPMFYVTLPMFSWGLIYYWYISIFEFVLKMSLNKIFILVIMPFTAIPATLAILLLLIERQEFYRKKIR